MIEKFSGPMRELVAVTVTQAEKWGLPQIDATCMLRMILDTNGVWYDALVAIGIDPESVKVNIPKKPAKVEGEIPWSDDLDMAIFLAGGEAFFFNHKYIGIGHLILGMVSEGSTLDKLLDQDKPYLERNEAVRAVVLPMLGITPTILPAE